ncbi:N-acetylglucosaminidase [Anaerorhabdus sp.]|uniref:N-acetylglucosaminidase n=1 Tax=Anaerorhabdus sp. TaxID=1872524 RepID=UPI002FCB3DEF
MNKLIKFILSMTLVFSSLVMLQSPIVTPIETYATDMTSMGCSGSQYEVATANTNGTFTTHSCHNSFSEAQNKMWGYGDDGVVRHASSKSPMKIVSMSKGLAISYPMRSGSSTMNITQDYNHQYKKVTYVTKHREMIYNSTYSYNGDGNGTILVNITGFKGTADLANVDLVPYAFLGSNVTCVLGGNDTSAANEQPFRTHVYQAHYEVNQNGSNKELTYVSYSGWSSNTWPAVYNMTVGLAADWMNVGTYYSYDGYTFYSDAKYTNKVGTYYNYYQFLPTRTKSNIPASVFDNFLISVKGSGTNSKMKGQGQTFINAQNSYGINALLVYSLACLESAYGTSDFALNRNNLFGWNAFDSNPGSASYFSSIEAAINEHMGINLRGYTDIDDSRFFGSHVGNKGSGFNVKYAADPYWGYKIAAIAYSIDKASGFADYNKYSVGVINTYGVNVNKTPNGSKLYNSAYGATYQENHTVAILGSESGNYKIQSTNPISGGNLINGSTKGLVGYDWNQSVGFIPTGYVTGLNSNTPPVVEEPGTKPEGTFKQEITQFSLSNGKITLFGNAYQPGIYADNTEDLKHYLIFDDGTKKSEIELIPIYYGEENYSAAGFAGIGIDITTLTKPGTYSLSIKTVHEKYTETKAITNLTSVATNIGQYMYAIVSTATDTKIAITQRKIEENYVAMTKSLTMDDAGVISVSGLAYVEGRNNSKEKVKHRVDIIDLANDKVIKSIDLTSKTGEYDPSLGYDHGLDYSHAWFEGVIPTADLSVGEYKINLVTTADGKEFSTVLRGSDLLQDTQEINLSNKFIQIKKENTFLNRFEIKVRNYQISFTPKGTLPTYLEAYSFLSINRLNETKDQLILKGSAYIKGASFSDKDEVKYTLLLVNESTGKVLSFETLGVNKLNDGDSYWNNTTEQSSVTKYNYDYTWFEFKLPLESIEDGKYNLKLIINTKDYSELVDIKDSSSKKYLDYTSDTKSIKGSIDKFNKTRVMFDIKGFYVNPIALDEKVDNSMGETPVENDSKQENVN